MHLVKEKDLVHMKNIPRTTTIGSYPVFPSIEDVEYYEKMASKGLELTDPYLYTVEETLKDFIASGVEVVSTGQTRGDLYSLFLEPKFVKGIGWRGSQAYIENKIERISSIRLSDVKFARSILPENFDIKEPITDAYTLARFAKINTELYMNTEQLAREINREIVSKEIDDLQSSGCVSMIQLDSPVLAAESYLPEYVSELYEELSTISKLPVVLHACGDTTRIFDRLSSLKVNILSLDFYHYPKLFDHASNKEYEQKIGLGVLDSQSPRIESVEEVSSLIKNARNRLDDKIVFVHPHCGQRSLHRDTAFEKNVRMTLARDDVYFGEPQDVSYSKQRKSERSRDKYFIVSTNRETKEIIVTFYSMEHHAVSRYRSKNAEGILNALGEAVERMNMGKRDFAVLALEVGRAEASLQSNAVYRQRVLY
jgi:5-methyltetrahydropteroyltriglutamate--homocysteine methyltransferase